MMASTIENPNRNQFKKKETGGFLGNYLMDKELIGLLPLHYPSLFFVLDLYEGKFRYVDPGYRVHLGLNQAKDLREGSESYVHHIHKADYKIFREKLIPDLLFFFKKVQQEHWDHYSISFNYRLKGADDKDYKMLLRSSRILPSAKNGEFAFGGFIMDITRFKEDDKMVLTIEKLIPKEQFRREVLLHSVYYPELKSSKLSLRELQILKGISQGLCSKEIAGQLCISEYTVSNHRKRMLKKLGCSNSSELLNMSFNQGVL